jgi:transcriptional regulator with XRE-family HTH domain
MTANQLVAYNLRRARLLRGWTQEEAARELEPYVGKRWSKAVWSAAETSISGSRTREFTADELLAVAATFDVPVGWFFLPPVEEELRSVVDTGGKSTISTGELMDVLAPQGTDYGERLAELYGALGEDEFPSGEFRTYAALGAAAGALAERFIDEVADSVGRRIADAAHAALLAAFEEGEDEPDGQFHTWGR